MCGFILVGCSALSLSNGTVNYNTSEVNKIYKSYTSGNYSCNDGYFVSGSRVRICQKSGDWDGDQAVCKGNEI